MNGRLVLGIDGGGSKTLLALADPSGNIERVARGIGINPLDNRGWREALEAQLAPFAKTTGLAAVGAALPAYGEVEAISAAQRAAAAGAFGELPQQVMNDVDAAHLGAFGGGPGILILSGTGSMAWARDAAGKSFRVGGWGDVIGDEGSGHWIGMEALGLASRGLDGRAEVPGLVEGIFAALELDRADPTNGLEGWVAGLRQPRAEIAALAQVVGRLAEAGDAAARGIIEAAAAHLALHVTTIARQSGLEPAWSYAGGTFGSRVLRDAVAERLGRPPVTPRLPPIGGALLAAARLAGWPADEAFIGRMAAQIGD